MTRTRTLLLPALLPVLLLAAPPPARAAGARAFPFDVRSKTLDNGLVVYAVPMDSPGVVGYYTVVRTGSRNELESGRTGFAHFFEHMMFRGTKRFPAEEYNRELKVMGADSNAFTTEDLTVYFAHAGAESLPRLVELEADRFANLEYGEAEFQKEAGAVLGEYNKSASDPDLQLEEALATTAFELHPYGHTVIGFLQDVQDMPNQIDYARTFFDRWYRPDNVVVVAAGDLDPDRFFALAEKHYGGWARGGPRPEIPQEPPQKAERRVALKWPQPTLPRLWLGIRAPGFTTEADGPAFDVLGELLFAERAPLYRRLVIEEQRAVRLRARRSEGFDPGLFLVRARVKDAADLALVEKAILDELRRIEREGVDTATREAVLSHMRYRFARELDTPGGVAFRAAWYAALGGSPRVIDAYYDRLAGVTSNDIRRVARQALRADRRVVVTLTPEAGR